jgi:hypothetical protein
MPKLLKVYDRFDGGLNTRDSQRSIKDNEVSLAENVIFDDYGMIKSCGFAADNDTDYSNPSVDDVVAGYGFFQASFDYNAGGTNTPTVRTFMADTDDNSDTQVDIFDAGGSWAVRQIDLGGTTGGKVIYDMADGIVRVCDANLGANNTPMWYGYISRKLWLDEAGSQLTPGSADTWAEWLSAEQGLYKPWSSDKVVTGGTGYPTARGIVGATMGINGTLTVASSSSSTTVEFSAGSFGEATADRAIIDSSLDTGKHIIRDTTDDQFKGIASGTDHDTVIVDSSWSLGGDSTVIIAPDAGLGFDLEVVQAAATGVSESGMTAATYEFAQTFIYDGIQESLPSKMAGVITVAASKYLKLAIIATRPYNKRITGGRMYWRDSTTKGEWELLADISLIFGCRTNLDEEYTGWAVAQLTTVKCTVNIGAHNLDTFETLNGYPSDVEYNHIGEDGLGYKTSVVANRRRFIANVKTKDLEKTNSVSILGADRVMYSEINKFDTIIPQNFIDIGINDGEEFIKLESYADRLLLFKERTLYIVNIGSGSDTQWFLEAEHKDLGVLFHAAVTKTEFGVAWANKNGLYIYDGSEIKNLQKKILESDWKDFVNDDSIIGYEPVNKHLCVIRDADNESTDNGDAYICNLNNGAFTFIEDLFPDGNKSNIITDAYNKMTATDGASQILSYDGEPDSAANKFAVYLKDDDFGLPGVVKKVYGIQVEYSSSDNGTAIWRYTDKDGVKQGTSTFGTLPSTSDDLDINVLYHANSGIRRPIECNSYQLLFSMEGTGVFKINSITVEYRPITRKTARTKIIKGTRSY